MQDVIFRLWEVELQIHELPHRWCHRIPKCSNGCVWPNLGLQCRHWPSWPVFDLLFCPPASVRQGQCFCQCHRWWRCRRRWHSLVCRIYTPHWFWLCDLKGRLSMLAIQIVRNPPEKYQKISKNVDFWICNIWLTSGGKDIKAKAYSLAKAGKAENEAGRTPHLVLGIVARLPKSIYKTMTSVPLSFSTLARYHWSSTNLAAHKSPKN